MHNAAAAPFAAPSGPATTDETRVVSAVRAAALATGVSFEYLLAQANQESGLDPQASSRRSSAAGLFQFTASTWLDMVKRHGAAHGLAQYADAIATGSDGRLHVADPRMRHAILEMRRDPGVSAMMAGEYAKENQRSLEHRLGRPVSSSDLYLAHFLGAAGAAKVLERKDAAHDAARLLPDAARANPELFHEPGSRRSRSVASLYRSVQASFAGALDDVAPVAVRADLAALRPEPRPADAPGGAFANASGPAAEQVAAAPADATPAPAAVQPAPMQQAGVQQAVASTAAAAAPGAPTPFANAIDPASPFFPVPLPPPASVRGERLTLRDFGAEDAAKGA